MNYAQHNNVIPYPTQNPVTLTSSAANLAEIKNQVNLIQQVMREVMKEDEHFGVIPGCGNKPALLKPGAEKLMLTFRLANDLDVQTVELPNFHREYRVKATIFAPTGQRLGTGVGSCSTMESKYRYRTGPIENTGRMVPQEYWTHRESNPAKAQELLGGKGFSAKKVGTKYYIVKQGERVEFDNPADYYNTVLKMAKKRALVDAVLTSTAASDIFTQDLEEDPDLHAEIRFPGKVPPVQQGHVPSQQGQASTSRAEGTSASDQSPALDSESGGNAAEETSHDEITGYLSVKNVKHDIGDDGTIYAYPEFSDSAARTWLKDQKFKWDSKNKRWTL